MKISDLEGDNRRGGAVRLCGKGAKTRLCPLWPRTMTVLAPLIAGRPQDSLVFLNRYGAPVTRFGIHTLVERHAKQARERCRLWRKSELVRTRFVTRRLRTFCVQE